MNRIVDLLTELVLKTVGVLLSRPCLEMIGILDDTVLVGVWAGLMSYSVISFFCGRMR